MTVEVVLCLGSNLGDRAMHMRGMEKELSRVLLPPVSRSRLMETEPLGVTAGHPWYYNRLVRGRYEASARDLLDTCRTIEERLGRTRPEKYAPRTADIDIVLFGDLIVNEQDLIIPHRHILDRRFCMEGLKEIAGEWVVPGYNSAIKDLARTMGGEVRKQKIRVVTSNGRSGSLS
jgi:2-amino-4-hydroxy-6-hydroxymethyldihydropteridine diphosphokinase